MKKSLLLRKRLQKKEILVVPGVQAALFAKVVENAGFEAVYATGAGIANLHLGIPDIGLATMTEVLETVKRIVDATTLPVIADIDDGYGNHLNVYRTVKEFTKAGVAALQLEDQKAPKRCGHFRGKNVVTRDEMVAKIKAARDASVDDDLILIARTDAIAPLSFEEALERAQAYGEAGADLLFVEAPENLEQLASIPGHLKFPVMANMVEGGKTPLLSSRVLEEMGYKIVVFANATLKSAIKGLQNLLNGLKNTGSTSELENLMVSMEVRNELTRLKEFQMLDGKYGRSDEK